MSKLIPGVGGLIEEPRMFPVEERDSTTESTIDVTFAFTYTLTGEMWRQINGLHDSHAAAMLSMLKPTTAKFLSAQQSGASE